MAATDLAAVFGAAFAASTLLPGGSEVALVYADSQGTAGDLALLAAATAGNTLGGMSSWLVGRLVPERHFDSPRLRAALDRLRRHGAPALLLSWVPVVGDPLCLVAGWLRVGWLPAMAFMALGKGARYAVILWLV